MGNENRPRNGPLTPIQDAVLKGVMDGKRQRELAKELNVREGYVSGELGLATAKMGGRTTVEAACRRATAEAYIAAAELLERNLPASPEDNLANAHVHHIMDGIAEILRGRAARLLP